MVGCTVAAWASAAGARDGADDFVAPPDGPFDMGAIAGGGGGDAGEGEGARKPACGALSFAGPEPVLCTDAWGYAPGCWAPVLPPYPCDALASGALGSGRLSCEQPARNRTTPTKPQSFFPHHGRQTPRKRRPYSPTPNIPAAAANVLACTSTTFETSFV